MKNKECYMTEQLPITININSELTEKFSKIASVCNKLEAQFNFHTLMENWYGDEQKTLSIKLALENQSSFIQCQAAMGQRNIEEVVIHQFSDDVMCVVNNNEKQLLCYIAVTKSETELLTLQPKLLPGYLEKKLKKVLNLIAESQSLPVI